MRINLMKIIKKLWLGYYPLGKSYWFFGNIIPVFFTLLLLVIGLATKEDKLKALQDLNFIPDSLILKILFYTILFIYICYIFISTIGIWRSATQYQGKKIWSYLAKFFIVLIMFLYLKDIFKYF